MLADRRMHLRAHPSHYLGYSQEGSIGLHPSSMIDERKNTAAAVHRWDIVLQLLKVTWIDCSCESLGHCDTAAITLICASRYPLIWGLVTCSWSVPWSVIPTLYVLQHPRDFFTKQQLRILHFTYCTYTHIYNLEWCGEAHKLLPSILNFLCIQSLGSQHPAELAPYPPALRLDIPWTSHSFPPVLLLLWN